MEVLGHHVASPSTLFQCVGRSLLLVRVMIRVKKGKGQVIRQWEQVRRDGAWPGGNAVRVTRLFTIRRVCEFVVIHC